MWGYESAAGKMLDAATKLRIPMWGYESASKPALVSAGSVTNPHVGL